MSIQVNVSNGTRAGWRKVRQTMKKDWLCPGCDSKLRYYWLKCPHCGHPRVEA